MEQIKNKLNKFTFDELITVISLNFSSGADPIIELCELNKKECTKENIIEELLPHIKPTEIDKFKLIIDFLLIFCRTKTWMKYEIRDQVSNSRILENDFIENFDVIKAAIEQSYQELKKKADVSMLFLSDRIFMRIGCEGEKRQFYFQALPSHGYMLAKKPVINEVLEIVINSLGFNTYRLLEEIQYDGSELTKLFEKQKSVQDKEYVCTLDSELFEELETCRKNYKFSQRTELSDISFIDQKIPNKINSIVIKVNNAKLGNAVDFPELKEEIDDDLRYDTRIKLKSKTIKDALKLCKQIGIMENSQMPEYIRQHFSQCSLNEINYTIE